jgi:protein gp37
MADTSIEWTDVVWNPTTGCDRVSPGCDHCYAMTMAKRLKGMGQAKYQRDGDPSTSGPGFRLTVHPTAVNQPLRWREPRKVFVNSMSDLFHKDVPSTWLADIFAVMAAAPQHTFQVLTKRHARMKSLMNDQLWIAQVFDRATELGSSAGKGLPRARWAWPLPNVWLGVSVEDQPWADIRIPALIDTPAAVRWISAEPLLGPIDLRLLEAADGCTCGSPGGPVGHEAGCGTERGLHWGISWVVAGGESGPGARPMHPSWVRSLRDQCSAASVPYLLKQRGAWTWDARPRVDAWDGREPDQYVSPDGRVASEVEAMANDGPDWSGVWKVGKKAAGRLLDGHLHDEYPTASTLADSRSVPSSPPPRSRPTTGRPSPSPASGASPRTSVRPTASPTGCSWRRAPSEPRPGNPRGSQPQPRRAVTCRGGGPPARPGRDR